MTTKTEASPANPVSARAESFQDEVRSLKIKDPNAGRDALYLKLGLAGMVLGIGLTVIGYLMSHSTANVETGSLNDAQTLAMIGIALTVAAAAVFLRYSFANFMRFWLARFIVEQQKGRD